MVLKQLQLIGRYVVGEQDKIETYLNSQKEYRERILLTVTVDLINSKHWVSQEEYDFNKERLYLRGMRSGNKVNLSPAVNFKLGDLIKSINKEVLIPESNSLLKTLLKSNTEITQEEIEKYFSTAEGAKVKEFLISSTNLKGKIVRIKNKIPAGKHEKFQLMIKLADYVEEHHFDILASIFQYVLNDLVVFEKQEQLSVISYVVKASGKTKKTSLRTPMILFKIIIENDVKYPGEIEEFKELYVELSEEKVAHKSKSRKTKNNQSFFCYTCGKEISIDDSVIPNIGFFTLDQLGFSLGFIDKKKSVQLRVCDDCNREILKGYTYVSEHLNFWAFKTDKGEYDRNGVNVNHYIIPITEDKELLIKAVEYVSEVKREIIEDKKKTLSKEIQLLETQLARINKQKERSKKTRLSELIRRKKNKLDRIETSVDIKDVLVSLSRRPVTFYDIYYYVTDPKQNPSTKEVIGYYVVEKPVVEYLGKILSNYPDFEFWRLRQLVNSKVFLSILGSLYNQKVVSSNVFIKSSFESLIKSFLERVIFSSNKNTPDFHLLLNTFKSSYGFLLETNVFAGE